MLTRGLSLLASRFRTLLAGVGESSNVERVRTRDSALEPTSMNIARSRRWWNAAGPIVLCRSGLLRITRFRPILSRCRGLLAQRPGDRSLPLDMMRGIAILLVLGIHCVAEPSGLGLAQPVAELWRRIGWAGVDLFFVLSGFLVSG